MRVIVFVHKNKVKDFYQIITIFARFNRNYMESLGFIEWCLDNLNYWTITLLMAIESSFIPFPSEIVVPPAAYKAAATGELNVWLVIFFATLGALIGAFINYLLAMWLGKPIEIGRASCRERVCLSV